MEHKDIVIQLTKDELKSLLKETIIETLNESGIGNKKDDNLMNIQEAAAMLNLAVATIYEKTSTKAIPHYKHGKKILFKKSELVAWVESRKVKSLQDIRREAKRYHSSE